MAKKPSKEKRAHDIAVALLPDIIKANEIDLLIPGTFSWGIKCKFKRNREVLQTYLRRRSRASSRLIGTLYPKEFLSFVGIVLNLLT